MDQDDLPQTAMDKFLTSAAHKLNICQQDDHWTLKVSGWLLPANGCGCCLAWRGLVCGAMVGSACTLAAWAAIYFLIIERN